MQPQQLVDMANQIGQYFDSLPERREALSEFAQHLINFWAPTMRQALLSHMDTEQVSDLTPLVVEALIQHRHRL